MAESTVILHDAVHPHMEIPEICFAIINTPHFQRLKNLKQLATCHFVYPSASNNRYEHCIGVCYLAGEYGRILQKKQPELEISEEDILCLQIAGLCHDLGHGPFSHSWEVFVKSVTDPKSKFNHEEVGLCLFDHMLTENNLVEKFASNKSSLNDKDLEFIKSLMVGDKARTQDGKLVDVGRGPEKNFLYEIVANEITKIDVDKFDYLLRDCKFLNLTTAFDYRRVMKNSKVYKMDADGGTRIVYDRKVAGDLEDLFRGRLHMHKIAYQHKTNKMVEEMLVDGFRKVNGKFRIPGAQPRIKLSNAHESPSDFVKLTDSIFEIIMNNWVADVDDAAVLFKRIVKGDYYKCLGHITLNSAESHEVAERTKKLVEILEKFKDLSLFETTASYGASPVEENPLNSVYFHDFDIMGNERIGKLHFGPAPWEKKYYLVVKDPAKVEEVKDQICSLDFALVDIISVRGNEHVK